MNSADEIIALVENFSVISHADIHKEKIRKIPHEVHHSTSMHKCSG